jgi:hypothetical protein
MPDFKQIRQVIHTRQRAARSELQANDLLACLPVLRVPKFDVQPAALPLND